MTTPDLLQVHRLLARARLGPARELVPLVGGANNRVFRVNHAGGSALLKSYFRHPDDPRDRLGAEVAFARFAQAAGVRCIPQALAHDVDADLGLFEMLDGRPVTCDDLSGDCIAEAIEFVRILNGARWRPLAARLPVASEACFTVAEHLGTVNRRVSRLQSITPESNLDREAIRFVERDLVPIWELIHEATRSETHDNGLSFDRQLELLERCISPSDFGFHNALIGESGEVWFLDFEYAGWDDPAKLICDFFCQPTVPIPGRHFNLFARAVADCFPSPERVFTRSCLLLPVYRVKWISILLNEFLPLGIQRRAFSLTREEGESRKVRQLLRAREALTAIHNVERVTA